MVRISVAGILIASALSVPAAVSAQIGLPLEGDRPSVHLELAKPFFDSETLADLGFATSMLDATVVVPTSGGARLFAHVGLAHATIEGFPSSTTLSNPRLGVLLVGQGGTHGELHVDVPIAQEFGDDDYATAVAVLSDFERFERFVSELFSLGGSLTGDVEVEGGAVVGGRVGGDVLVPTEEVGETEVLAVYGAFIRIPADGAALQADLSGRAILTEADLSFDDQTVFLGTIALAFPEAGGAPEVFARFPLDGTLRDVGLNAVLGVRVRLGG